MKMKPLGQGSDFEAASEDANSVEAGQGKRVKPQSGQLKNAGNTEKGGGVLEKTKDKAFAPKAPPKFPAPKKEPTHSKGGMMFHNSMKSFHEMKTGHSSKDR
jgi:hypothetical protein